MNKLNLGAVVLAAGLSKRMGTPKLVLPWHGSTIIRTVIDVIESADISERIIVLGSHQNLITPQLSGTTFKSVYNPYYKDGDMLKSIQIGIRALTSQSDATLIVLGDQPTISLELINKLKHEAQTTEKPVVVPSYNMKRGHPWIIKRALWDEVLGIKPPKTLRDILNKNTDSIHYVLTDDPHVLSDMDTPEMYQKLLNETQKKE